MKTSKTIKSRVIYSIIMALLSTLCLVTVILLWYKADNTARYALLIPIACGYAASIWMFIHRKPINQ